MIRYSRTGVGCVRIVHRIPISITIRCVKFLCQPWSTDSNFVDLNKCNRPFLLMYISLFDAHVCVQCERKDLLTFVTLTKRIEFRWLFQCRFREDFLFLLFCTQLIYAWEMAFSCRFFRIDRYRRSVYRLFLFSLFSLLVASLSLTDKTFECFLFVSLCSLCWFCTQMATGIDSRLSTEISAKKNPIAKDKEILF